jgi:hypothetical protein
MGTEGNLARGKAADHSPPYSNEAKDGGAVHALKMLTVAHVIDATFDEDGMFTRAAIK